jgi:hypothetical protein
VELRPATIHLGGISFSWIEAVPRAPLPRKYLLSLDAQRWLEEPLLECCDKLEVIFFILLALGASWYKLSAGPHIPMQDTDASAPSLPTVHPELV